MNFLDLIILALVLLLAVLGYLQGFIVGIASLFGVVLGGLVGTRAAQYLLERAASDSSASTWAPVLGLAIGLLITVVGAMAAQDLGAALKSRVRTTDHIVLDHTLGAVLLAVVGLVLTWFSAAAAIGIPQIREYRGELVESRIVQTLNEVLPPAGPVLGALSSYDPFPAFDGGRIKTAAPDPELEGDASVKQAAKSVVRVIGTACGYTVTGSGWTAARGYIVTNAHVVAGESDTAVQVTGRDAELPATVVVFDQVNDLALLRVDDLWLQVLPRVAKPAAGTAGVIIGFPEHHGLVATAARYSDERRVRGDDIYGTNASERTISSFRGLVRHGNSGGPVVDSEGSVLTTVFAATIGEKVLGGYGVPNSLVASALEQARKVPRSFGVRTGSCVA
ncbi:MAG: MarP family serine protease [Thermoleophilia bacterium]|nr:MarP family serine protease [Thermoleophilia bacterium]